MKIYRVTYQARRDWSYLDDDGDVCGDDGQDTIRIKAESLEQAQKKAIWGLSKIINVREETEAERRQLRRERARYHAGLEGTLRDIGLSEGQIEEIKKRDEQRKQQEKLQQKLQRKEQRKQQRKERSPVEINTAKARTLLRRIGFTDDQIEPYLVELRRTLATSDSQKQFPARS